MSDDFAAQVAGLSVLADPVRRALYRHVVAQPAAVGRDQAAAGVGVARHIAKFHLDRLVEYGLLEAEYRRLSGRRGPGAGRPAKLYRRSNCELTVTLPERHYELVAELLAAAVAAAARDEQPIVQAIRQAADEAGRSLATRVRATQPKAGVAGRAGLDTAAGRPEIADGPEITDGTEISDGPEIADGPDMAGMAGIAGVLAAQGYEPRMHGGQERTVELANCPFEALARRHPELVCGMNLDLIAGLLAALGRPDLRATLDPAPGRCCVTVGPAGTVAPRPWLNPEPGAAVGPRSDPAGEQQPVSRPRRHTGEHVRRGGLDQQ